MSGDHTASDLAELQRYLGESFDPRILATAAEAVDSELEQIGDEQTLYRTSEAYLYDLTAFAMSGTKRPYLEILKSRIERGAKVLDYGCGIGSDGLELLAAGYDVSFADFDNPSTRYLRWRLEQRGLAAPVYDLDADILPTDFELAFAFDVIEHVPDAHGFLAKLESVSTEVLVNLLMPGADDTELHHRRLPLRSLMTQAALKRIRLYRCYYGRSHLVCSAGVVRRGRI